MDSPRASNITKAYHLLFDYPLDKEELERWRAGDNLQFTIYNLQSISKKSSFQTKKKRRATSLKKLKIARRAAKVLERIPAVRMIAVTGSLAMMNAHEESDIDLMTVTAKDTLWTTRIVASLLLTAYGLRLRRSGDKEEKDKLCLNIWLDEGDLNWRKKNIFIAHEICQIIPLVNKDKTYEKFLWQNKWVLGFWPKAVKIRKVSTGVAGQAWLIAPIVERLAFWIQYQYMRSKITRETVTKSRALFHPIDWSARLEKEFGRD